MTDAPVAGLFFPTGEVPPHIEDRHMERLRREFPGMEWRLSRTAEDFPRDLPFRRIAFRRFRPITRIRTSMN